MAPLGDGDLLAEWDEGNLHELEVLSGEGDADDGDGEDDAEDEVQDGDVGAAEADPEDVHEDGQAAGLIGLEADVPAERKKRKARYLHGLQPKRNSYDGDHKYKAADEVEHGEDDAPEQKPENVSECRHGKKLFKRQPEILLHLAHDE